MSGKKLTHSSSYYRLYKKLKTESEQCTSDSDKPTESATPGPSGIGVSVDTLNVPDDHSDDHSLISESGSDDSEWSNEYYDFEEEQNETDAVDSVERNISFKDKLRQWAIERSIKHTHLDALLTILREHGHETLPKDSRTLLQTPAKVTIRDMGTGQFWYNGIEKNLKRVLKSVPNIPENISLMVNVDGIAPFDSSPKQFWPILILIHELRETKPFVAAIFYGDTKPPLNQFFEEFVEEMNALIENGIDLKEDMHISIRIRCFVCDTPARSYILGTPGSNAEYGSCLKCTVVGEFDRKGRHMSYPRVHCPLRTDASFRQKLDEDHHKEDTPLTSLPINMIEDFVVADSLHLIDLGITRRCLFGWREGSYNFKTKFSKNQADSLSQMLQDVNKTRPVEIQRRVRSLKCLKFWKGSEYRVFLLYLGPIFLKDILAVEVYEHFVSLSCAIRILSCNYYLKFISIAENLIDEYIEKFIEIYGIDGISSNVHNLIHMVADVKKFGPLPSINAYPFEDKLGHLKALVRHGNCPLSQVAKRYEEMMFMPFSVSSKNKGPFVKYQTAEKHQLETCEGSYKQIHINDDFILAAGEKDCYFLTNTGDVVYFINGTYLNQKIHLYGQKIENMGDFFL